MKQTVIFVPGLGDAKHGGLERLLKFSLGSLDLHYLPLIWSRGNFAPKLKLLVSEIDKLTAGNTKVSLLGTSAGASAVINAYVQRRQKVDKVILICGKLRDQHNYQGPAYRANPAFKESILQLQANLSKLSPSDKQKFFLFYSQGDTTVPPIDAKLTGTSTTLLPRFGHVWAIVFALSFGARKIKAALAK